jgi:predicted phage baseplate assembly protein
MADGRLVPPNLDDRTWQDLVNEVRGLIPKYAPQWTDHNPSDLGMTLVELFAWLVEGMIYRLNRVPEKHYIEFLNLLGITRDPATPARTQVTFTVTGTPTDILKGTQVATPQSPTEEPVVFETDADVRVLPIDLAHGLFLPATGGYRNYSQALVKGSLEETTIAVNAGATVVLALGFSGPSAEPLRIFFDLAKTPERPLTLTWTFSQGNSAPNAWTVVEPARVNDGTSSLTRSGMMSLTIPATWQAQAPPNWTDLGPASPADAVTDSRFWVGLRLQNTSGGPAALALRRVGFNAVSATHALTVNPRGTDADAEPLGGSTGQPSQTFVLKNPPLYQQPQVTDPYNHLTVQVREPAGNETFGEWTSWTRVNDFPPGSNEVYKCNPVTGDIIFGDHDSVTGRGRGKIPPPGSQIRALTYRYVVGGVRGNVPPQTISVVRDPPPGASGVTVINPGPATGGSDQESIEETKRRAPEVLKNRDRAVTLADYEYLAREASTDVTKVRALPEFTNARGEPRDFGGLNRAPGHINVIIIPDTADARPRPEADLLVEVSDYVQPRRPATAHLHVHGPRYLPIRVIAKVNVWSSARRSGLVDPETYHETIITKLQGFLHPTRGKQDGRGWEVGESVYVNQIFAAIQPPPEVGFIASIELEAANPDYGPGIPANPPPPRPEEVVVHRQGTWVQLADYEIVCYGDVRGVNNEPLVEEIA